MFVARLRFISYCFSRARPPRAARRGRGRSARERPDGACTDAPRARRRRTADSPKAESPTARQPDSPTARQPDSHARQPRPTALTSIYTSTWVRRHLAPGPQDSACDTSLTPDTRGWVAGSAVTAKRCGAPRSMVIFGNTTTFLPLFLTLLRLGIFGCCVAV